MTPTPCSTSAWITSSAPVGSSEVVSVVGSFVFALIAFDPSILISGLAPRPGPLEATYRLRCNATAAAGGRTLSLLLQCGQQEATNIRKDFFPRAFRKLRRNHAHRRFLTCFIAKPLIPQYLPAQPGTLPLGVASGRRLPGRNRFGQTRLAAQMGRQFRQ